ncbi:MAG: Flp family type IVb pilin [Marmoricola sp.]
MLEYIRNINSKRNEDGASAVEYGLLVAAIAALIVIVVFALGGIIHDVFRNTCDTIDSHSTTTTTCTG